MFSVHFSRNCPQHIASSNSNMYIATLGHAIHICLTLHFQSWTVWLEKSTSIIKKSPSPYLISYEQVLNIASEVWHGVILVGRGPWN